MSNTIDENLKPSHKGFTSKATNWQIVHTETYPSKELAMQREKQLKSWKSNTNVFYIICQYFINLIPNAFGSKSGLKNSSSVAQLNRASRHWCREGFRFES